MSAPAIFLSYNREDQAAARRFAEGFEGAGLSVWWDVTLRSGEAYDTVTEQALRGARAVVVLWSKRSVDSRWVRAEATLADRNRTLVPARIEACDLPIMFELTQTADLSHWQGESGDAAWRAFLGDVRRMVDARAEPKAPAAPSTGSAAPKRGARPSIAILPFINRSGLGEDDVFADGMVEDLNAALSVSRRMKVIASSATAAYRQGARDLHQIGRDLGVRYLLEGNVRRVGSDLRVTAQLVEAEDGDILWTQKFDRPLAELASLQEDLVTEVAAHLGVEVQRAEMEHALRKPGDITAWEAVLRADASMSKNTESGFQAAIAEARRAIEIDPGYPAAYASLATGLALLRALRGGEDAALAQQILDAVGQVRALEPDDPVVLVRLAWPVGSLGRYQEALPLAQRAVAINSNLELPHISLADILLNLGRRDEALAESAAAERLAPNGIWSEFNWQVISVEHFHEGRFEQALEAADRALRVSENPPKLICRMLCLARLDRWDEALSTTRHLRETNPEMPFAFAEKLLRNEFYNGPSPVRPEENVETVRRLWDEAGGDG